MNPVACVTSRNREAVSTPNWANHYTRCMSGGGDIQASAKLGKMMKTSHPNTLYLSPL